MADALVSVVVEKLGSALETELTLFAGARHELEKLKRTFQSIQAVLADAESRQVADRSVQLWLSRLRNIAYDISDVMDEWERSNDGGDTAAADDVVGDGNRAVAAACLSSPYACLNHTVSRFKVAHRIKEIREKLDEINQDREQFQFIQSMGSSSSSGSGDWRLVRSRTLTSPRTLEKMIGREEEKEKVINKLVSGSGSSSDNQDGLQVHVIAIVGIGGLGKTTLAREIYNDSRVKSHFNEFLWVCVSQPFDVINIIKAILEHFPEDSTSPSQLNPLQNRLEKALREKRFLLVLDDVWNEDKERWSQLQASLTSGAPGSRILVTTRTQQVANTMSPAYIQRLQDISNDDSWKLFSEIAFAQRNREECAVLEGIGRKIVGKCNGVPLSLKVMGSAVSTKSSAADWQNILDSKMWSLPQVTNKLLPALLLSYYNLPQHLKQCFVYCSVYPKDAQMYKKELVKLWIVQGFVRLQGNRELEDIGAEYFDELVARSMFQEVEEVYGRTRCKMHDLLHDLAEFITEDETYIYTREKSNRCPDNVRHASLFLTQNNPTIPIASLQAKKLQTLFLNGVDKFDGALVDFLSQAKCLKALLLRGRGIKRLLKIIGKLKHLRYLDLSGTWVVELPNVIEKMKYLKYLDFSYSRLMELPNVIGKLKHLRYMDLSVTRIVELPESVAHLRNLHTLKLNRCRKLKKLPRGMGRMVSLRHLEIEGTDSLECLPKGLGRITFLRTLSKFIVGGEGGCGIDELQQLNSLQGDLVIQNLERVSSGEEARGAELCNKQHLRKVVLEMQERDEDIATSERDAETERMDSVLEGLRPPANLEKLKLHCNRRSSKLPSWMGDSSFSNLTELKIGGFIQCEQNNLPGLGKLPALKYLEIRDVGVKKVGHESCYGNSGNDVVGGRRGAAFPKLEQLVLQDIELGEWELTLEAFLQLRDCSKLEGQPHHLANTPLTKLRIVRCHGTKGTGCFFFPFLEEFTLDDSSEFLSSGLPHLPNLKKFYMRSIRNETLPDQEWEILVGLQCLEIHDCNELKSLPDGLTQLQSLENLQIEGCNKLESLPEGLGHLKKLQSLRISGLEALTCLHDSLGQLESLQDLEIEGCKKLQLLPEEGLGHLKKLQSLRISGLEALTCLHDSLGQLESLQDLEIEGCNKLESLPEGLGQLKKLQSLRISGLEALTCLHDSLGRLESLENLKIKGCNKLESLPEGLGQLKNLQSFRISGLEALTRLHDSLGQLESLENLKIKGCDKLESLPEGLGQLKKLRSLQITGAEALTCVPNSLGQVQSLEHLRMDGLKKLQLLPEEGLGQLKKLKTLKIGGAEALTCLPNSLGELESLEDLDLDGLKKLGSLPEELGQLKKLEALRIGDLEAVTCLPNWLGQLESLERLEMNGWKKLESLPHWLGQLKKLEELTIKNMEALICLPDSLGQLESLWRLDIRHCNKLKSLPRRLQDLPRLQILWIAGCPLLSERCKREGGVEWPKISRIPRIHIDGKRIE